MAGWLILIAGVGLVIYHAGIEMALWSGLVLGIGLLVFGRALNAFLRIATYRVSTASDLLPVGRCDKCRAQVWLHRGDDPAQLRHLFGTTVGPVEYMARVPNSWCGGTIQFA
jgi:hypothetical protein